MTTRCAWCADSEPTRPEAPVSHGICRSCLDTRLAVRPPERPARRSAPAALRWLAVPQPAPVGA